MQILSKLTYILVIFFIFFGCTEKISYSGKIQDLRFNYDYLKDKNEVLNQLGEPSFIDFIEQKYFYYSEKKITKNFFDNKIIDRSIISFKFDNSDNISETKYYSIENNKKLKILKETTKNEIMKRGLIEKLFGGVGKNSISNTP